jgi:hypothetical protein
LSSDGTGNSKKEEYNRKANELVSARYVKNVESGLIK